MKDSSESHSSDGSYSVQTGYPEVSQYCGLVVEEFSKNVIFAGACYCCSFIVWAVASCFVNQSIILTAALVAVVDH